MRSGSRTILTCFFPVLLLTSVQCNGAESDSLIQEDTLNGKRLSLTLTIEGGLSTGGLIALDRLWYQGYPRSGFHWFSDGDEWLQMDKMGHFWTAYHMGRVGKESLDQCGVDRRVSRIWGGLQGTFFLTAVELMDGHSKNWGASPSDAASNLLGSAFFIGQDALWGKQLIDVGFSFHPTRISKFRPDLLGEGLHEEALKDYNGQTYWLSVSPNDIMANTKIPAWIDVSFGYGGQGMLGGKSNPLFNENGEELPSLTRYRQYYLSLDLDLTEIPVKSKFLRSVLFVLDSFKVPFPALEVNGKGRVVGHWMYF